MTNNKEITIRSSAAEYLTYVSTVGDNANSIEMRYEDENIWLTQKMMSVLYGIDVRTINDHIQKIFEDNELEENPILTVITENPIDNDLISEFLKIKGVNRV